MDAGALADVLLGAARDNGAQAAAWAEQARPAALRHLSYQAHGAALAEFYGRVLRTKGNPG